MSDVGRSPEVSPDRGGATYALFATSRYVRLELVGNELVRRPRSLVHAKRWGTTMTVCGLLALNMERFWELDFHQTNGGQCPDCLHLARPSTSAARGPR
jgi:hypothetical protein